jgi:hypothetical protein
MKMPVTTDSSMKTAMNILIGLALIIVISLSSCVPNTILRSILRIPPSVFKADYDDVSVHQ